MWFKLFGTMDIKDETNFEKYVRLAGEYLIDPKKLDIILHKIDDSITQSYYLFQCIL